jgi:hypothetical protein
LHGRAVEAGKLSTRPCRCGWRNQEFLSAGCHVNVPARRLPSSRHGRSVGWVGPREFSRAADAFFNQNEIINQIYH